MSTVEQWAARVARVESAYTTPNAVDGSKESIVLQQSRLKPTQEEEPRSGQTTTKPVPMESEKPTGPATQHGGSSGLVLSEMTLPVQQLLEVPDVVTDAEDSCEAQVKRQRRS